MKCSRCDSESVTRTRGEYFCEECYHFFVSRKFRAAMGDFRVNGSLQKPPVPAELKSHKHAAPGQPPLVIVFLSYGICSIALIDLLLDMQEAQKAKNNGMCGFDIHLAHIGANPPNLSLENWPWPQLSITDYPCLEIEDVVNDTSSVKLSRSTKQDMHSVLVRQTAQALARRMNATAIFGYSITRLSELTLAETIKGRGAAIPNLVSPNLLKDHSVYPLKDITLPEIEEYCRIRKISQFSVPDPSPPGITKMQSIDEIVHQYFVNVQRGFPSVVSTVAKVASRLSQPAEECALCNPNSKNVELCYACSSALHKERLSQPLDVLREFEL